MNEEALKDFTEQIERLISNYEEDEVVRERTEDHRSRLEELLAETRKLMDNGQDVSEKELKKFDSLLNLTERSYRQVKSSNQSDQEFNRRFEKVFGQQQGAGALSTRVVNKMSMTLSDVSTALGSLNKNMKREAGQTALSFMGGPIGRILSESIDLEAIRSTFRSKDQQGGQQSASSTIRSSGSPQRGQISSIPQREMEQEKQPTIDTQSHMAAVQSDIVKAQKEAAFDSERYMPLVLRDLEAIRKAEQQQQQAEQQAENEEQDRTNPQYVYVSGASWSFVADAMCPVRNEAQETRDQEQDHHRENKRLFRIISDNILATGDGQFQSFFGALTAWGRQFMQFPIWNTIRLTLKPLGKVLGSLGRGLRTLLFGERKTVEEQILRAINEQTKFLRTGTIERRGFLERGGLLNSIGEMASSLVGLDIGAAERAEQKNQRGEELTTSERFAQSMYQGDSGMARVDARNQQAQSVISGPNMGIDFIGSQVGQINDTLKSSMLGNLSGSQFLESLGERDSGLLNEIGDVLNELDRSLQSSVVSEASSTQTSLSVGESQQNPLYIRYTDDVEEMQHEMLKHAKTTAKSTDDLEDRYRPPMNPLLRVASTLGAGLLSGGGMLGGALLGGLGLKALFGSKFKNAIKSIPFGKFLKTNLARSLFRLTGAGLLVEAGIRLSDLFFGTDINGFINQSFSAFWGDVRESFEVGMEDGFLSGLDHFFTTQGERINKLASDALSYWGDFFERMRNRINEGFQGTEQQEQNRTDMVGEGGLGGVPSITESQRRAMQGLSAREKELLGFPHQGAQRMSSSGDFTPMFMQDANRLVGRARAIEPTQNNNNSLFERVGNWAGGIFSGGTDVPGRKLFSPTGNYQPHIIQRSNELMNQIDPSRNESVRVLDRQNPDVNERVVTQSGGATNGSTNASQISTPVLQKLEGIRQELRSQQGQQGQQPSPRPSIDDALTYILVNEF